MAGRAPRPSTDEETAPLLRDTEVEENSTSVANHISSIAQEPLTALTKILLVITLVLLLLSSVFIGLFAGAQHKLNDRRHGGDEQTHTVTATTTLQIPTTTTITTTTIISPPSVPTGSPEEICLDPQCILISSEILSSLDTSSDPCENFYEFANGGWLNSHPLPSDKSSFGSFEALANENKQIIRKILESHFSTSDSYDKEILAKLRDHYSSCMAEDQLNDIGEAPLYQFTQIIRRMYRNERTGAVGTESKSNGLTAALAFLHSRGIDSLFSFEIEGDVGVDPNHMVLWFNQPSFGLPSKEYYEEESVLTMYQDVLEQLLTVLDEDSRDLKLKEQPAALTANEDSNVWPPWPWPPWGDDEEGDDGGKKHENRSQQLHKLANHVVKFERRIAQASLDLEIIQQDPMATYNPVPLSNLTESLPQVHFPTYFSTFTPRTFPDRVIMTYPEYVKSLSKILNETSNEVVESYLVLRAGLALSPYLGSNTDAWRAQRSLLEALTGIKKGAVGDRSEYCIDKVEQTLGFAAGRYFVNETFAGAAREKGTKVITDIVKAFKNSLSNIDWMDEKSAKAASEKADAIRVKVGYPLSPDTQDPRSISRYYSGVKISNDTFFKNMLSASESDQFKRWLQLGKQRDMQAWEMYPSMVNAYFNPSANEIVFPAGILRPPFFSQQWPGYLSYGAFGHVAAHELTHAFDSAGRLYNQEGKLEKWWTNATSEGFKEKQECIVNQYSAYTIDDGRGGKVHVNGNLTSGENIGDTGLIQAYRAWKAQYNESLADGTEYLLPGLNFTRDQLFFIGFGRIWARAMKPAEAIQRIRTDPHSPSRYRTDGTVYNMPEFAKAFKCSKHAKLNPPSEKRCLFWT